MGLKSRIQSFTYAFAGLGQLFKTQPNARIHIVATVLVLGAGFYFHIERWEWAAILLCIGAVIALEAVNTAIESLTDLVSPEFNPLAGRAKDFAAAAVLWAVIVSVFVAGIIFIPKVQLIIP